MRDALQKRILLYDKSGEEHYNLISALHKSVRNSDPDAALYWLGRMLEAGEDPLYIARRVVRMAVEDIGLADPNALSLCMAARDAVDFIGMPEGNLALAQAVVYLSVAPKSNALYTAYGNVLQDVESTAAEAVPLHLRNAPTRLMKGLGYGRGYQYAHDVESKVADMTCLPDSLRDRVYYQPTNEGIEKRIRERLDEIKRQRSHANEHKKNQKKKDRTRCLKLRLPADSGKITGAESREEFSRERAIGSDWTVSSIVDSNFPADYSWTNYWGNRVKRGNGMLLLGMVGLLAIFIFAPMDVPETAFNGTGALVAVAHPALPRLRPNTPTIDGAAAPHMAIHQIVLTAKLPRVQATMPTHSSPGLQPLLCTFLI